MTKNLTLLIFLFVLIISCKNDNKTTSDQDFKMKKTSKTTVSTRNILRDKVTCKITPNLFEISDTMIDGLWKDSLHWIYEDTCWYGLEPIDLRFNLELHKSKKYIWEETATDTNYSSANMGEYWTFMKNDTCYLLLASNMNGDTLFNEGDSISFVEYQIYSLTENKLRIRPLDVNSEKEDIIYEYTK